MDSVLQKSKPLCRFKNDYVGVFVLCLLVAAVIFIPFLIMDHGYFLYYGDFNVQQIPFYKSAHEAVKSGEIFWNWKTDLGVNFIGSYSFYLLTSPYFWITLLFPNSVVPLLMAPLLILKFACAGLTGFAFLKRFTRTNRIAAIGAVLYAFSGFNQFNIFFNHFHEAVIIFPLLLVALEEFIVNDRFGYFALAVFASAFVNYFFFVGQAVFTAIYFFVRLASSPEFRITPKKFLLLAFEAVLGTLLACVILVPSVLAIIDNPRTSSTSYGMNLLLYYNVQRYGLIIESLFFPPDIPSRPNFFPDSNAKWASVSAYLPLFSMVGVLAFFKKAKKHWLKRILGISLVMALVPVLNSMFFGFNSSYYGRWYYMPVLMMALATCYTLQDETFDLKFGVKVTAAAAAVFTLVGFLPTQGEDGKTEWMKFPPYVERFWGYVIIAMISLLLVCFLIQIRANRKRFMQCTVVFTCLMSVVSSITVIATGRQHSPENAYNLIIERGVNGKNNFSLDQSAFYRVDEYELQDNMPMFWDMPTIQCFHSIVPASVMEFYQGIDVQRDVASRPDVNRYGIRALTSVKYMISNPEVKQPTLYGFKSLGKQNGYYIYENEYFIPMGFTYDNYVSEGALENYAKANLDKLMLHALVLPEKEAEKYDSLLDSMETNTDWLMNEDSYYQDCTDRAASSGYEFSYDNSGFRSKIRLEKENLVFYSVPYDKGWSAYVDGKKTDIIKANIGFMAVHVPEGDHEIRFRYETPGLKTGAAVSGISLLVLAGYWAAVQFVRRKNAPYYANRKQNHRKYLEFSEQSGTQNIYINNVVHRIYAQMSRRHNAEEHEEKKE